MIEATMFLFSLNLVILISLLYYRWELLRKIKQVRKLIEQTGRLKGDCQEALESMTKTTRGLLVAAGNAHDVSVAKPNAETKPDSVIYINKIKKGAD